MMTDRKVTHVLSVDTFQLSEEDMRKFVVLLKNCTAVKDWHSPFIGVFFLKLTGGSEELYRTVTEYFDGTRLFFVNEISKGSGFGDLSTETFNWFKKYGMQPEEVED